MSTSLTQKLPARLGELKHAWRTLNVCDLGQLILDYQASHLVMSVPEDENKRCVEEYICPLRSYSAQVHVVCALSVTHISSRYNHALTVSDCSLIDLPDDLLQRASKPPKHVSTIPHPSGHGAFITNLFHCIRT
jgi:hypothetical protein